MTDCAYRIHIKKSIETTGLVLELLEATRGSMGWELGGRLDLSKLNLTKFSGADAEILRILKAESSEENKAYRVPGTVFSELIPLLGRTGRLFCGDRAMVVNAFKLWELRLHLDGDIDAGLLIEAELFCGDQVLALGDCSLFLRGPQSYMVHGSTLRPLHEDVPARYLGELWPEGSLMAEGDAARAWLKRLSAEECPEGIEVKMAEGLEHRQKSELEPLPLLQLADPKGAFAQLAMCYGNVVVEMTDPRDNYVLGGERCSRTREAEIFWEKDLLETGYRKQHVGEAQYYCPLNEVGKSLSFLLDLGWNVEDGDGRQVRYGDAHIEAQVRSSANTLLVRGRVCFEDHEAKLQDVIGAFNRRDNFVSLGDGSVALLGEELQSELESLSTGGELVQAGIKLSRQAFGALGDLWASDALECEDKGAQCLQRAYQQGADLGVPSSEFIGALRTYQSQGLAWMQNLAAAGLSGLLADDMGLGKTVQVLAFLSHFPPDARILIVMPTSLLFNWQQEFERFLPERSIYLHHGSGRVRTSDELPTGVVLTSYALMRLDAELLGKEIWDLAVLDEAQMIKNPDSQTARAAYSLPAQMRLSMTGTPVENRLEELWAQFHFLSPGLLGTRENFAAQALAGQSDSRYLRLMRQEIRPFLLRRKKEEVAKDLPEKIEQLVWVEMSEEQRRFYENFLASARSGILKKVDAEGMGKMRMQVLETILRLRQICCHPLLLSQLQTDEPAPESAKLRLLGDDVRTLMQEGKKVLVYSQFTSMLGLMRRELEADLPAVFYLDGKTRDRGAVVEQFQAQEGAAVFFISLKAGGVGLNLSAADYVLLFDPWWNQALEAQAIDRAHRIGRTDTVVAKRYVVRESIEERMVQLKARKSQLAEGVLGEDFADNSLDADDLRFLLG